MRILLISRRKQGAYQMQGDHLTRLNFVTFPGSLLAFGVIKRTSEERDVFF
jgi:hypothetical protein